MPALNERSLMYSENLTPPSFQVIVMTANMRCSRCRQRVSQVASKINGLKEYTVDLGKGQVIIKAEFGHHWKVKDHALGSPTNGEFRPLSCLFKSFRASCFGNHLTSEA